MTAQNLSATSRLRALLKQDGMIVAPGAYECISARVIAQAERRISADMSSESSGSARVQPVRRMMIAATLAAAEPSRSLIT